MSLFDRLMKAEKDGNEEEIEAARSAWYYAEYIELHVKTLVHTDNAGEAAAAVKELAEWMGFGTSEKYRALMVDAGVIPPLVELVTTGAAGDRELVERAVFFFDAPRRGQHHQPGRDHRGRRHRGARGAREERRGERPA